jgi:hypothetical protein
MEVVVTPSKAGQAFIASARTLMRRRSALGGIADLSHRSFHRFLHKPRDDRDQSRALDGRPRSTASLCDLFRANRRAVFERSLEDNRLQS